MSNEVKDKKALQRYFELKKTIQRKTESKTPVGESLEAQKIRIARLLENPETFAKYYFAHYCDSDFGWFHKKAFKTLKPMELQVYRWFRGAAKSVTMNVLIPTWRYFKGDLQGLMLASATESAACVLIGDIQAEFESNELLRHDFGDHVLSGSWSDGEFITKTGVGFWALGLGQSPRGKRVQNKRPNHFILDDVDTKERCKNHARVKEAVEWAQRDFFQAADMTADPMFFLGNNRIAKHSIMSYMCGDIEKGDKVNPNINLITAYAIENPKTHERAELADPLSKPSWSRYTKEHYRDLIDKVTGEIAFRVECQHEDIEVGNIFKNEWMKWAKKIPISKYDNIAVYLDPSYKDKKVSDYKAIICVGQYRSESGKVKYRVFKAWVRQTSISNMVQAMFDLYDWLGDKASYYMEANFMQADLLDAFDDESSRRGYVLPIQGDYTKKEDKETRIQNMTPLFERDFLDFCESQKDDRDMLELISQFLAFPTGHDDAPDATHGALSKLKVMVRATTHDFKAGKFISTSSRR